jgi:CRISPR-associated protein (TIGR02584 family)
MQAFRDILVAVVGLTPQVITETVYYLTQVCRPPVALAEIHVLTTLPGQEQLRTRLLAPAQSRFSTFCHEYGLDPAAIRFEVHLLRDASHVPLEDIRTQADSAAVADQIATFIRRLTDDPTTRLHCSLAGGRKTQSVLLGFALQLYGRPQDTLLHVLVSEEFQDHPDFFYPSKESRLLRTRDGHLVDAREARIEVAEIPYPRLREKLLTSGRDLTYGFGSAVEQAQYTLDTLLDLPSLVITRSSRSIRIGAREIVLPPLEFVLYSQLAQSRLRSVQPERDDGFVTLDELENMQEALLQRYESLYGPHAERVAMLRKKWAQGMPWDSVRSHFANINRKISTTIPDVAQAVFYRISSERLYGRTRYGLRLPPGKIVLREA